VDLSGHKRLTVLCKEARLAAGITIVKFAERAWFFISLIN
jgi:hypothetical protein